MVIKKIYELCEEREITPHKLAKLSTVAPPILLDMLYIKVSNNSSYVIYQICKPLKITIKDFFELVLFSDLED